MNFLLKIGDTKEIAIIVIDICLAKKKNVIDIFIHNFSLRKNKGFFFVFNLDSTGWGW